MPQTAMAVPRSGSATISAVKIKIGTTIGSKVRRQSVMFL